MNVMMHSHAFIYCFISFSISQLITKSVAKCLSTSEQETERGVRDLTCSEADQVGLKHLSWVQSNLLCSHLALPSMKHICRTINSVWCMHSFKLAWSHSFHSITYRQWIYRIDSNLVCHLDVTLLPSLFMELMWLSASSYSSTYGQLQCRLRQKRKKKGFHE